MTNPQGIRGWVSLMVTAILMMLAAAIAAPAQTYSVIYNFGTGGGGELPQAGLTADSAGNLYGTTGGGRRLC
jgi:hypothetical protein